MSRVVGIDLGTTNSLVAYVKDGVPVVIRDRGGDALLPSIVSAGSDGTIYVGREAQRRLLTDAAHTVYSVKRFMGKGLDDVKDEASLLPFRVGGESGGVVRIGLGEREFTPPEISAFILRELKRRAEAFFAEQGEVDNEVDRAVITVPAYFNDAQRTATRDAGRIAGLDVLRIINEPTAASLAYGLDKEGDQTILVFDLGGGTFDVSVLELGEGVFEVKATSGDNHLGGDNFDKAVVDWLIAEFKRDQAIDLGIDPMALQRLYEAAEKAKIELSTTQSTNINLPFITADAEGPKHLDTTLSRAKLTELTHDLIERTVAPTKQALADSGLEPGAINQVILVGGMTRMPAVQEKVKSLIGRDPHRGVNPDEVVAIGAAIQAGVLKGEVKDVLLLDVTPLSLGIETKGGVFTKLIERNTTIPSRKSEIFSTAEDGQPSVEIHVLQGEREMAAYNKTLGKFQLVGIAPSPRGVPQIEVTFDIDANGIMHVSAKDKGTGNEQKIQIQGGSGLSDTEVDQMVRDAESHAEDDRQARELAEARNSAEQVAYSTEKSLAEHDAKLDDETKTEIRTKIDAVKQAIDGSDVGEIRSRLEALREASFKLGEMVYQQAQQSAATGAGNGDGAESADAGDEEIVDAEVVDETGDRS